MTKAELWKHIELTDDRLSEMLITAQPAENNKKIVENNTEKV